MRWGFTSGGQGKNAGREKPAFFSWAEMKGRGIPPAEAASLPSSPCLVPGCPGPGSSCSPPFPSRLSLFPAVRVSCACLQQQRDGPVLCRCVQGGVLPPRHGGGSEPMGSCQEGPRHLPEQRCWALPLVLSRGAPIALDHITDPGEMLQSHTSCGCVPHFLPGLVALSPAVAQGEVTHVVLSARQFRMRAGGWLALRSCSAQTVGARFGAPARCAVAGPLLSPCKTCGCMGTCWLMGKCGLASGLRAAPGAADTTWPPLCLCAQGSRADPRALPACANKGRLWQFGCWF